MIKYSARADGRIAVRIDKKLVGFIKPEPNGWRYYPKGQKTGGDLFPCLSSCKLSLEIE